MLRDIQLVAIHAAIFGHKLETKSRRGDIASTNNSLELQIVVNVRDQALQAQPLISDKKSTADS